MNLTSLSEHELLVFWVQMLVILVTARGLGFVARRVGQPAVVGELAAGLVLGPSLLGRVWPGGLEWFIPPYHSQSAMLLVVGWLGVVFLVFATGYETDLRLIAAQGKAAIFVSTGSLLLPIALGGVVGYMMPAAFIGAAGDRVIFALFMAAALSISSLPVIAKILGEMGLMRRNFGQLTVAAGMANDVVGWLVLGVIAGLAAAGELSLRPALTALIGIAVFVAFAFTVGQRIVDALLRRTLRGDSDLGGRVAVIVTVAFGAGAFTQWLGVEAVIGAFIAGIVVGRSRFRQAEAVEVVESFTAAFLAPVFFATAGLRVDVGLLRSGDVIVWALVIVAIASLGKFAGAWIGALAARLPHREGLALGAGLNARGALEIVIATVGLSLGVLNQRSYTVIVIMAVATSMLAPPLLRVIVRTWRGSLEEQERIKREQALSRNVLVSEKPVLLPNHEGCDAVVAAQVIDLVWPRAARVTVVSTAHGESNGDLDALNAVLHERPVEHVSASADSLSGYLLDESRLNYGAVVLGAGDDLGGSKLSAIVQDLLRDSGVPVVIIRRGIRDRGRRTPSAFARALVPVTGSKSSRAAQEIAFQMSQQLGTEVSLLHVEQTNGSGRDGRRIPFSGRVAMDDRTKVSSALMKEARVRATNLGATAAEHVRSGLIVSHEVVTAAADLDVDLVVLGATLRRVAGETFLGDVVADVLERSAATVVVVALPEPLVQAEPVPEEAADV